MYKKYLKRFFDFCIALVALPFFGIIYVIVAPIVHFTDGGPAFYCGERIGLNGKKFKMYKFRSMRVNAPDWRNPDGSTFNSEDDPRVTKIGKILRKTSLDEIPQVFNILRGDMSLIGPRPNTMVGQYPNEEKWFLTVRPGITGYSQAYYRNGCSDYEKAQNDMYYAQHISFVFDLKIFGKTVETVISRKSVFRNTTSDYPKDADMK